MLIANVAKFLLSKTLFQLLISILEQLLTILLLQILFFLLDFFPNGLLLISSLSIL